MARGECRLALLFQEEALSETELGARELRT